MEAQDALVEDKGGLRTALQVGAGAVPAPEEQLHPPAAGFGLSGERERAAVPGGGRLSDGGSLRRHRRSK